MKSGALNLPNAASQAPPSLSLHNLNEYKMFILLNLELWKKKELLIKSGNWWGAGFGNVWQSKGTCLGNSWWPEV